MAEPVEPLTPQLEEIPDKLYFRIGEVARLTGVKQYVLRFWESEFPGLGPKKSGSGHRLFRRKDVEMVLEIKRLLYDKRFTIEGARKALENKPKPQVVPKGTRAASKAAAKAKAEVGGAPGTGVARHSEPSGQMYQQQQAELFPSESLFSDPAPGTPGKASRSAIDLGPIKRELRSLLDLLR